MFVADVNECDTGNGGCDHNCQNIDGGFKCSCNDGFQLMDDLKGCQRKSIFESLLTVIINQRVAAIVPIRDS